MSNDMNTGANKLIERILEDARADAAGIANQAQKECEEIRAQSEREAASKKQTFEKQREEAVKAIMERSRTNAELHARKQALDKRREVLDRVFGQGYDELCALDDEKRGAVITDLILKEAEGGEAVKPAKADRNLIGNLLSKINESLKAEGKASLTLLDEDAHGMAHGFILSGAGFEKDCSFYALLRDARMLEETNVSGILFNS